MTPRAREKLARKLRALSIDKPEDLNLTSRQISASAGPMPEAGLGGLVALVADFRER